MTMMTPISNETPATFVRHPEAERLSACAAVVGEMLAGAALILDMAATLPSGCRSGLHQQSRLRLTGAALLLSELGAGGEDVGREISDIADTIDPDLIRETARRLDAIVDIELHQISIGIAYDRYA